MLTANRDNREAAKVIEKYTKRTEQSKQYNRTAFKVVDSLFQRLIISSCYDLKIVRIYAFYCQSIEFKGREREKHNISVDARYYLFSALADGNCSHDTQIIK